MRTLQNQKTTQATFSHAIKQTKKPEAIAPGTKTKRRKMKRKLKNKMKDIESKEARTKGPSTKQIKHVHGFVMNKVTGHPSFAYRQDRDNVDSLGFTHNKNDFADKIEIKNINPKEPGYSYVKTKVEHQKFNKYKQNPDYKGYRIHPDNKLIINKIINDDKKKRK